MNPIQTVLELVEAIEKPTSYSSAMTLANGYFEQMYKNTWKTAFALTMTTEDFAKLIIKDCISTWSAIDNGNLVEGTDYLPKALYKRYGLEK